MVNFGKYGHVKYGFGILYGANPDLTVTTTSSTVLDGGTTGTSPVDFTIDFNRYVVNFDISDIIVSSGTKINFTAVTPSQYTFQLLGPHAGSVTVDIPANVAQDGAEFYNLAADQFNFNFASANATGHISGTRTTETWIGHIIFDSNIIIPYGTVVTVDTNAYIQSNGFVIIVQDGGYLDTQGKRLPFHSAIGSVLIIN